MSQPFVGIQMGAHSIFANGAEPVLDRLVALAGVTSVQVNVLDYYGWSAKPRHGRDVPDSPIAMRWTPERYAGIGFAHADDRGMNWAGRDVVDEVLPAARARGISVHARILEGFRPATTQLIPGFAQVLQINALGHRDHKPCWNHPAYRQWWLATIEDLVREHPIDGILLGPERDGPLGPLLHDGVTPGCFCAHCCAQARAAGVDVERARTGMLALQALMHDREVPREGMPTAILRCYLNHPEILHWERLQAEAKWSLHAELVSLAHLLSPKIKVGLHVCMYGLSWDLVARATTDYRRLAGIFDYLKPSTYWDVNHARLAGWIRKSTTTLHRGMKPEAIYGWILGATGHDPEHEPAWKDLAHGRCSPEWIRREVERCVADAGGRCSVYSGIGIDIPHNGLPPVAAQDIEAAVTASFAGGADGLLLSREYEFMRDESLAAVGRTVRSRMRDESSADIGRAVHSRAFTLVELLVTIAIIATVTALLLPAVAAAMDYARKARCASALRQVGMAYYSYAADHEDAVAFTRLGSGFWLNAIAPYADASLDGGRANQASQVRRQRSVIWGCPSYRVANASAWHCGYGANPYLDAPAMTTNSRDYSDISGGGPYRWVHYQFGNLSHASRRPLVVDLNGYQVMSHNSVGATASPGLRRHRGRANVLHVDVHVETLTATQVRSRIAQPGS